MSFGVALILVLFAISGTVFGSPNDVGIPVLIRDIQNYSPLELESLRNQSKVNLPDLGEIESYAGYLVHSYGYMEAFFWYFPAKENPENAPVILFLEGTPGKDLFFSVFAQNGPLSMGADGKPVPRAESWNNKHHMVYIDTYDYVGYHSYPCDDHDYRYILDKGYYIMLKNDIKTFFQLFPQLMKNDLFLAGNYNAAVFLHYIGNKIDEERKTGGKNEWPNFKGLVVANGLVKPRNQLTIGKELYERGVISSEGKAEFLKLEDVFIGRKKKHRSRIFVKELFFGNASLLYNLTGYAHPFDIRQKGKLIPYFDNYYDWIQSDDVRRALHIGNYGYYRLSPMPFQLMEFLMRTTPEFDKVIGNLSMTYPIFMYTGEDDILCTPKFMESWLKNDLRLPLLREGPWLDSHGAEAGYLQKWGNITTVSLKDAAHFSSMDQPQRVLELVENFTHNTTWYIEKYSKIMEGQTLHSNSVVIESPKLEKTNYTEKNVASNSNNGCQNSEIQC